MFMVGTAAVVFQTIPMFWVILVTYNNKSVIVIMLNKMVDTQGNVEKQKSEEEI